MKPSPPMIQYQRRKAHAVFKKSIPVPMGTILVHSIGSGHDSFWQVTQASPKSVKARRLEEKIVKRSVKEQAHSIAPIKDQFVHPDIQSKYIGGFKAGHPTFKDADINTVVLRITDDIHSSTGFRIGPQVRMTWWTLWDGTEQDQWSP